MRNNGYKMWVGAALGTLALAALAASCGGTGGGGGSKGNPIDQFVLNSNNSGRLTLTVDPNEVDANKSDRIGLTAQLTDRFGNPIRGITITFSSDVGDIRFVDPSTSAFVSTATTNSNGIASTIAIAGSRPTGTGEIIGTAALFATAPAGFGLRAQAEVTLLDVGFIDSETLSVIPTSQDVTEPFPGFVVFFNIVGGTPPYQLKNESSGIGTAIISQHCAPGCTENGGVLCVGSACQSDADCNAGGSSVPSDVCLGPIKRCLASCQGTNCGGSRCDTDADCNDGSPTPANVCKDSGQSIAYVFGDAETAGTHSFVVEDSAGDAVTVSVNVTFVCGNGVARGGEQCDLGDLRGATCSTLGFTSGSLLCDEECNFDTTNCSVSGSPGASTPTPGGGGATPSATPSATPTVTQTSISTPTVSGTPGPGVPSNVTLAFVAPGAAGDNGNGTFTTVIAATVTDSIGNAVPDGTTVFWSITPPTNGAVISGPSATNQDPPCDVTNFESDTGVSVLNQPGVAHACVTYPFAQSGTNRTITAISGAGSDSQVFTLP